MHKLAVVVMLGALASACTTTRAQAPIERPILDVPPAPPRIVEAVPIPEVAQPEPVGDLPPEKPAPPTNKPRTTSARDSTPRETAKPDAKPTEPPPPEPPATAQNVPPPPPPLRTPATSDTAAAARSIRDTMMRAQGGLGTIDYTKLTRPQKDAYDQAKNSIDGAEAAIKAANLELAKELAEKAEKLVRGLQGK